MATIDRYYSGTKDRLRLYVDGTCVMSADRTEIYGLPLESASDLLIGSLQGKYGFTGSIRRGGNL